MKNEKSSWNIVAKKLLLYKITNTQIKTKMKVWKIIIELKSKKMKNVFENFTIILRFRYIKRWRKDNKVTKNNKNNNWKKNEDWMIIEKNFNWKSKNEKKNLIPLRNLKRKSEPKNGTIFCGG